MKYDDDLLKAAYKADMSMPSPRDRQGCPSPESLARSFEPGASSRKKRRIIDHLGNCSFCREEFQFYHELQEFHKELRIEHEEDNHAEAIDSITKGGRSLVQPLLNYGFLLLGFIIISSVLLLLFKSVNISDTERSKPSVIILAYPTSSHHMTGALTFRWKEYRSAKYYILELFNDSLEPLWTSPPIQGVQIRLPHELGDEIKPGSHYYWMVTAYSGSTKTGESKLAQFVIR
jgi:hypothetical protein